MPPKSRAFSAPGASLAPQHRGQLLRKPSSGGSLAFSQHSAYLFQHSAVSIVGNIAEGKLNFTSTSAPSKDDVSGIESDAEYEVEKDIEREASRGQNDDDLQMMDGANPAQSMAQVQRQEINGKKIDGGSRKRPKNSPKKRNADGLVQVIERLVHIKEKEANKEAAHDFSIGKCMDALKTLEGVSAGDKILALEVFKDGDNHEIFVNLVADKDGTAIAWLRAQIAKLT